MEIFSVLVVLFILFFSVVVHEFCHGYAAYLNGDDTARMMGRLTLNPIPHIDPFGTILLPILLLLISGGRFAIGMAKPV
ncbi:MAG TPA: site-2 protease family protein, partial [bacterium]|nr:site-2 protease family protein [bacterium]